MDAPSKGIIVSDHWVSMDPGVNLHDASVSDYGRVRITSGGTASRITIGQNGFVQVDSGGWLNGALFLQGSLVVLSGGTATDLDICEWSSANLRIDHGAIVTFNYKHPTEGMQNAKRTRSAAGSSGCSE